MPRIPSSESAPRTPDGAKELAREFGRLLKAARAERMGQTSFAQRMGVSRTTISNIERGAQRVFLDQLYRAAEILGISMTDLLPDQSRVARVSLHVAADDPIPARTGRKFETMVRDLTAKYATPKRGR